MKKTIHTYGDAVLRKKARPVEKVDDAIRALVRDMLDTMREERGVGLAAEQVGEDVAVCVIEVPPEMDRDDKGLFFNPGATMPLALINPKIVAASRDTETAEEGCLSFPGIYAPITRPVEVTVEYLDTQGKARAQTFRKFVARAVQHEMDHLNGVLFVDHMSALKKIALAGQLKRLKRETKEAMKETNL
ncbi:MAG TPA: peptide deformylase [Kiritimatiellia bacterium]|nr:peptide deformylase [Kiritimatiellia bacterium]HRZ12763.1 peptide deformylase [Kiritimatiellia bacterium]HSA18285.1 peptide deformylase [Kiritimatiellia bacterium]